MKNLFNPKKLNNKGFSLVELIIVIAIMAVLIGVLAPQYMKYVEKSRQSADLDNYQAVISAIQVYVSDKGINAIENGTITLGTSGTTVNGTKLATALSDAGVTITNIKTSSASYSGKTIKVAINSSTGNVTFTVNDSALANALGIGSYTVTPTP